jgi:hypothetical protein
MIKEGQSLLDFINFFPLQALHVRRSPVSDKEAKTLYEMFKSDRDPYGRIVVPSHVDSQQISTLASKGLLNTTGIGTRTVEITAKGKEVIRNIILFAERSQFEKSSEEINYDSIYRRALGGDEVKEAKIASSWLKKAN